MLAFTVKRLGLALLVALTVSLITFSMIYVSGDPAIAIAGEGARLQDIEAIRKFYGFDRPIIVQYFDWLLGALRGDFGRSFTLRQPVADVIFDRLPVTIALGASAIAFALVLAIPLGVLAAVRPNSIFDRFALTVAVDRPGDAHLLVRAHADPVARRLLAAACPSPDRPAGRTSSCRRSRSATT